MLPDRPSSPTTQSLVPCTYILFLLMLFPRFGQTTTSRLLLPQSTTYPCCLLKLPSSPLPEQELRASWPLPFFSKISCPVICPSLNTSLSLLTRIPFWSQPGHFIMTRASLHRLQPISLISMPSTLEHSNTANTFLFQKISASLCHLQSGFPLLCLPGELLLLPNKLVPVSPPGWSTHLPGVRAPSPDYVGLHLAYSIIKVFTLCPITPARGT